MLIHTRRGRLSSTLAPWSAPPRLHYSDVGCARSYLRGVKASFEVLTQTKKGGDPKDWPPGVHLPRLHYSDVGGAIYNTLGV